jgi:gluconate 5-dehydrogenase
VAFELFDLTGKRALVTCSSQGIGFAIAQGLANHGAEVVLNGLDRDKLAAAAARLAAGGQKVSVMSFDVTNAGAVTEGVAAIEASAGGDRYSRQQCGYAVPCAARDFPGRTVGRLLAANTSSVFYVAQAVARHMIPRGNGKIINIGSVRSELARPAIAPYAATKGAVRNLTRGMCADWARYGLQINAIAPGYFKTPLNQALVDDAQFCTWLERPTPAARWGSVDELIGSAVFLSGSASSFVNGHTLYVDGGITTCL